MQKLNEACAYGRTTRRQTMFVMTTEFSHSTKEIKDLFLTTKIFGRKILITIWSCTHHTHLFRPTCLIINTCDQNWREMQNFHLRMQRLLLDCCELVHRCGWFFGRRGSLWGRCGSLWIVVGCCGVVVGRCGGRSG